MKRRYYLIALGILCIALGFYVLWINKSIDRKSLANVVGDYQCCAINYPDDEQTYEADWWHLSIIKNYEWKGSYFSIYDNQAGNPGVEGKIAYIDDTTIKIAVDEEFYEQLPASGWETAGDTLIVDYDVTEKGITLCNNNIKVRFNRDIDS